MSDKPLGLIHDCSHLRKLILDNPDVPIAIMVHEDACSDEFAYTYCHDVSASLGELLDCDIQFGDGFVYSDRDDLREAVQMYLEDLDEYRSLSDSQFDKLIDTELAKYEPYWKKAIIVTAGN